MPRKLKPGQRCTNSLGVCDRKGHYFHKPFDTIPLFSGEKGRCSYVEPAPPTSRCAKEGCDNLALWDGVHCGGCAPIPRAAPPTVAPARTPEDVAIETWTASIVRLTEAIERDRASRSPGHAFADCIVNDGDKPCRDCAEYALDAVGAPLVRARGLDAATIEACAREADCDGPEKGERGHPYYVLGRNEAAARIRALATPPGQAKP